MDAGFCESLLELCLRLGLFLFSFFLSEAVYLLRKSVVGGFICECLNRIRR